MKVEYHLDRFRAEEFWDRVMQEIADLLAERGPLTPTEILPEPGGCVGGSDRLPAPSP